jgi:hypothetical protein
VDSHAATSASQSQDEPQWTTQTSNRISTRHRHQPEKFDVDALIAPLLSEIAARRTPAARAQIEPEPRLAEAEPARPEPPPAPIEVAAATDSDVSSSDERKSDLDALATAFARIETPPISDELPPATAAPIVPERAETHETAPNASEAAPERTEAHQAAPIAAGPTVPVAPSAPVAPDEVDPMFFADDALIVPPPTPQQAERSAWIELVESLRQDIERLKAEREPEATAPPAPEPEPEPEPPRFVAAKTMSTVRRRPPAPPAPAPKPATKPAKPKPKRPAQDQWGLFDPDQCGFAALLAKLDEISARDESVR